jgi:hypothetical protein
VQKNIFSRCNGFLIFRGAFLPVHGACIKKNKKKQKKNKKKSNTVRGAWVAAKIVYPPSPSPPQKNAPWDKNH